MRRAIPLFAGVLLVLVSSTAELLAQRVSASQPSPGVMTVRSYSCGESQVDSAATILAESRGSVAEELVEEGLLLDYQVMTRIWGDEWNLLEYFIATDPEASEFAFEELGLRFQVAIPARNRFAAFPALCPRRKDSQYSIVPKPE